MTSALKETPVPITSTRPAIRIRGLVKYYSLGSGYDSSLKSMIIHRIQGKHPDVLRVLDGLDLTVPKGQALGICGANGTGKSTLLKIIAGIVPQTSGTVEVDGRVASLLELGAGFHPEMTGEENVFLNGAILGLPESALKHKMAAIFRTAGLERFATTPIKHYSSGMVQRLGFSIASHLDPDVLILDEVFAVGDMLFQHTARDLFAKFKARGKTILLVTHDLVLLEQFCDRVLILANGKVLMDGPPKIVTHQYATLSWQHRFQYGVGEAPYSVTNRMGDQRMRVEEVKTLDAEGNEQRAFRQFDPMRVRMKIVSDDPDLGGPFLSIKIQDTWGQGICQNVLPPPSDLGSAPPEYFVELVFDRLLLSPGIYSIEVILRTRGGWMLDVWSYGESFHVIIQEETGRADIVTDGFFHHPGRWTFEGVEGWEVPYVAFTRKR